MSRAGDPQTYARTLTKCRNVLRSLSYDAPSRHKYTPLTHQQCPVLPATANAAFVAPMLIAHPTATATVWPACAKVT